MDSPKLEPKKADQSKKGNKSPLSFIGFAAMLGELGFIIALPLVISVIIGVFLDKKFNTTPLFIICGVFVAVAASSISIGRKISKLNKMNGL